MLKMVYGNTIKVRMTVMSEHDLDHIMYQDVGYTYCSHTVSHNSCINRCNNNVFNW